MELLIADYKYVDYSLLKFVISLIFFDLQEINTSFGTRTSIWVLYVIFTILNVLGNPIKFSWSFYIVLSSEIIFIFSTFIFVFFTFEFHQKWLVSDMITIFNLVVYFKMNCCLFSVLLLLVQAYKAEGYRDPSGTNWRSSSLS